MQIFFFNDTATTEIYTLSLHDALPICWERPGDAHELVDQAEQVIFELSQSRVSGEFAHIEGLLKESFERITDRKSTRLNSSHANISYAVFCLKKKNPHLRP